MSQLRFPSVPQRAWTYFRRDLYTARTDTGEGKAECCHPPNAYAGRSSPARLELISALEKAEMQKAGARPRQHDHPEGTARGQGGGCGGGARDDRAAGAMEIPAGLTLVRGWREHDEGRGIRRAGSRKSSILATVSSESFSFLKCSRHKLPTRVAQERLAYVCRAHRRIPLWRYPSGVQA